MSIESALKDVADALGVDVSSLSKLINFESGFNPLAKNKISGARGLIQFMDSTARAMGYNSADDIVARFPDAESQLKNPVLKYLSQYKPFPTAQSLYMAVFYPKYRFSSPDTAFSEIVRKQNPGINFVRDYVNLVEKKNFKIITMKYSAIAFFVPVSIAALAISYSHLKRRRENEQRKGRKAG